jgi:L-ascorbate metabolism protein UlaG (beta-lactamase superfamily)
MDVYDAAKAVSMIKPRLAVPMHYGTFPVIQADPEEFVREVARRGFNAKIVKPGDWLQL